MNRAFVMRAAVAALAATLSFAAQQSQPPAGQHPSAQPAGKQPAFKSQAEQQALQAVYQAPTPDERIKAADDFITKFADSDFRALAFFAEAQSYQQKNDYEKMVIFGEKALEANPDPGTKINTELLLANGIAQRTREFDLDREEKLGRVQKYANSALEELKAYQKPNPNIPDAQWEAIKADFVSQAHMALGMAQMVRKNYDGAIAELKEAASGASPDPAALVRLGAVYNMANKPDDAIATLDKVMSMPACTGTEAPGTACAHPQVRQYAQAERARAIQMKNKGAQQQSATPSSGAAQPAPAPQQQPAPAPQQPAPAPKP